MMNEAYKVVNGRTVLPITPGTRFMDEFCQQVVDYRRKLGTVDVILDEATCTITTGLPVSVVRKRIEKAVATEESVEELLDL